ncbi:MAG: hypothetical protein C4523_18380 [Myxococcales bacterium]|nr:MAG: hypothetical protein C4523_18380 [Myxococcales bacterium]
MTTTRVEKIGYCAHDSKQGDWAFELAKTLAQRLDLQLNVFSFLHDPYSRQDPKGIESSPVGEEELVRRERELRLRYDDAAGEFVNVGFKLCHDNGWAELHRCLCNREFQLLVLAKPSGDAYFLGKSIDAFAESFICPTILVGPDGKDLVHANHTAEMVREQLRVPQESWAEIRTVARPEN